MIMKYIKHVYILLFLVTVITCNKEKKPEKDTDIDKWGFGF